MSATRKLIEPSENGLIEMLPMVRGVPNEDDGRWAVKCPYCHQSHNHSSEIGSRSARCLGGQYVVVAPDAMKAPYPHTCSECRNYFASIDNDPPAARRLRLRRYTPVDVEVGDDPDRLVVCGIYECNFGHNWLSSWEEDGSQALAVDRRCVLYRHYDADGVLLYVGISHSPIVRGRTHARSSAWVQYATRMDGVWLDSRAEAEAAEREAIAAEAPIFNIAHAADGVDQRIHDYIARRAAAHR